MPRHLILLLFALLTFSCGRKQSQQTSRPRVVSLSPSTTEAMYAIGAGGMLVGRSGQCDYPPAAIKLPAVGGFANPDIERVMGLRPTLVIGSRGPAGPPLEKRLRAHGVTTFFPDTSNVASIGSMLLALGEQVSHQQQAKQARTRMLKRFEQIERWSRTRPTTTVVLVFDASPLFVAGPGGFVDELLRRANATNLITRGGAYPNIDLEKLLALDPKVIVDAASMGNATKSKLSAQPGWNKLQAVREGRVRRLRSAAALRPGPRIAEGLADIAAAVHGQEPPS